VEAPRVGVAIGNQVLDIGLCGQNGLFEGTADFAAAACQAPWLNFLMSLGPSHWRALRERLTELLSETGPDLESALLPMEDAEMFLPCEIGDYTDFYASIHHATRVGKLFRPANPLLPNYKTLPIAYHGRASSVVVSGAPIRRPRGQRPAYGPTESLDYEIEVGAFIGTANRLGEPVGIDDAGSHVFGLCLLNDWSARDIQKYESQPLGPFLGKSFATSISPWVVTMDALAPYRAAAVPHDPAPLPYLYSDADQAQGAIDLFLEVWLRRKGAEPVRLSHGNFREMYWTIAQMVTHHTSNGCNLRVGDLISSGTASGDSDESRGCLLEMESDRFLEDGDEVILRGYCERPGLPRIGFGECRGTVVP
jgi:fumarylacetoacetase